GSYNAIKEIWSPVYFEPKDITPAFDGVFNIENRYHFTNTRQCSFSYQLKKWNNAQETVYNGSINSPDIKPMDKGVLKLALPTDWNTYHAIYITAKDVSRKEIFTWSFPITRPNEFVKVMMPAVVSKKVLLTERDSVYEIAANGLQISIHRTTGILLSVKKGNTAIPFTNGPVLQEGENNFKNFTHSYNGDTLNISSTFDRKNSYNTLQWTIYPSGLIRMKVNYFPAAYFTSMVGVNFSFPEKDITGVQYMGNGPYRVWKNRMKGNKFGIWYKDYNNTETGEAPWIYPEFKGYHANLYWCRFITKGPSFIVMTENEDLFLRLFTPAFKTDQWKNYEPIFPTGDISFMQGITSIGTKTQRNETTGPMGMKHIYYDYEKDPERWRTITLYFNFLVNE
ncbi:MAG: glycoside hydrolase family 2, partial [Chitinophagaceae bacterium]